MAEDIDFHNLPTKNYFVPILAGGIAGILEHTVMFPVDSVKTRMQLIKLNPNRSILRTLRNMIRNEGLLSPYRGMGAVVITTGPAHAMYFLAYETLKKRLGESSLITNHSFLHYGLAGTGATVLHDSILNPAEVTKQRLQMDNKKYKGLSHCVKCVYKTEGLGAFYRSFPTQLLMTVPFNCVNFITYENVKRILYRFFHLEDYYKFQENNISNGKNDDYVVFNPLLHLVAGSISGGLASFVTTPFDVIKTQLNTQNVYMNEKLVTHCYCHPSKQTFEPPVHLHGIKDAASFIYENAGYGGFFRGTLARIVYSAPGCAVCWSVYELFKYLLVDL